MKVSFHVKYKTVWGQRIFIVGSCASLGANITAAAKEMHYSDNNEWQITTIIPDLTKEIEYKYLIVDDNGQRTVENADISHRVTFEKTCESYSIYDHWIFKSFDKTFYTSAFTKNIFARQKDKKTNTNDNKDIVIRLFAPETTPEQTVAITGNQQCLGNWQLKDAKILSSENFPKWEIRLNSEEISFPLEYKFIVINKENKDLCYWEEGENRTFNSIKSSEKKEIIVSDHPLRTPEINWKTCGTVIPVFSLRSNNSFGIGDIGDFKALIDWTKKTGQHIIQVLPMNDTTRSHTWADSYPYSAISIYALHPLYISISMLGKLDDKQKMTFFKKIQKELNEKDTVDYESVETYKTKYYREYFKQEKCNILKSKDFKEFIAANNEWLIPYAAFSYLRDKNGTPEFSKWGDFAQYKREKIEVFCRPGNEAYDEMSYIFFIQYTLHTQFETITEYASKNNIALKGDIPIGIHRTSVEAWTEPEYFNFKGQSGAPPDDFSETGQNWSFPTYNWEIMEKDGFTWWKKRFIKLNNYFDCFRIDHILGFFRIWEIPHEYIEGLCGHFRPALPLSEEDIESYGLKLNPQWTVPHIHCKYLQELFGEGANDHLYQFLNPIDSEHLILNPVCDTQRKIKKLFEAQKDNQSQVLMTGLMKIANEVLFLRDPYDTKRYHPRISAYQSYVYRELSDNERAAFDRLYYDFYFVRHNDFWKQTALKRLTPLINSTNMLVCGEDLGMIPASVHEVMDKLQIFTLELGRLSKTDDCEFTDLVHLPYHSVCTTSTHDMNPIRSWWKEDRKKTQRYYNTILQHDGDAPEECTPELAEQIIAQHLKAPSLLTIIPLQDWFATDKNIQNKDADAERINIPANPHHYWRYRIHITLETLLLADDFNAKIRNLINENGR